MTLSTVLSHSSNGNGHAVNGRGLRHRKMSRSEALELAVEIALGRPFKPSLHHLADILGLPLGSLSKAVKVARAATQEANTVSEEEAVVVGHVVPDEEEEEADVVSEEAYGKLLEKYKDSFVLSQLIELWHTANPGERETFLREEIIPPLLVVLR